MVNIRKIISIIFHDLKIKIYNNKYKNKIKSKIEYINIYIITDIDEKIILKI